MKCRKTRQNEVHREKESKKAKRTNERKIVWNGIWFQIANNIDNDRLGLFLFYTDTNTRQYTWIQAYNGKITLAKAKPNKMSKHSTTQTRTDTLTCTTTAGWLVDNRTQWERKKCEWTSVWSKEFLYFFSFFFSKKIRQPIIKWFDLDLYSHSSNDERRRRRRRGNGLLCIQFNSIPFFVTFFFTLVYFSLFRSFCLFICFAFYNHCVHCSTC